MRLTGGNWQARADLRKLFASRLPEIVAAPRVPRLGPKREVGGHFYAAASRVLNQSGLDYTVEEPSRAANADAEWDTGANKQLVDMAGAYRGVRCEPTVLRSAPVKLQLKEHLKIDMKLLENPNLPDLPSKYTKSPNYKPVNADTPVVQTKYDLKGVYGPFMKMGSFNKVPFLYHCEYFSLKFVGTDQLLSAVRKSRPAIVVYSSMPLWFNRFAKDPFGLKLLKSTYFPSRSSAVRHRSKKFYRDLYFDYISKSKAGVTDGVLVVKSVKVPHSEAEKAAAASRFLAAIRQVQKQARAKNGRGIHHGQFANICKAAGLPFQELVDNFNSTKS